MSKKQFVSKKGDAWAWEETPEAREAIKRLHKDISKSIQDLEKEAPDYGVGK